MPNCHGVTQNRTEANKKYYESHKENMNIKRTELYHATKTEELLEKMRQKSRERYEAKKDEIKAKNLARYYENLTKIIS